MKDKIGIAYIGTTLQFLRFLSNTGGGTNTKFLHIPVDNLSIAGDELRAQSKYLDGYVVANELHENTQLLVDELKSRAL